MDESYSKGHKKFKVPTEKLTNLYAIFCSILILFMADKLPRCEKQQCDALLRNQFCSVQTMFTYNWTAINWAKSRSIITL